MVYRPNRFDFLVLLSFFALLALLARIGHELSAPLPPAGKIPISLDPRHLPEYALRSTFRMFAALGLSLLFTLTYATLAAKSRLEPLLVALLDILQSVPILGFLSFTVTFFVGLFPGRVLGFELASIFAVFTSQAWNMAFSFYQSLKTVPRDLDEAARLFGLSPWRRFWRLEVPFAIPGLVWNTMMSVSGGWFFVVASEAISVGRTEVALPGLGSYVAKAIQEADLPAVLYALLTMLLVIFLYDQLVFRPLVAWSEKFKYEDRPSEEAESWVLDLFRRTRFLRRVSAWLAEALWEAATRLEPLFHARSIRIGRAWTYAFYGTLALVFLAGAHAFYLFLRPLGFFEVGRVLLLGLITLARVLVLLVLAGLVWVPVGIALGLRPDLAGRLQALAQFLAAFPANLLYPIFAYLMARYTLSPEVFTAPLMVLGTQWYILFNALAGGMALPGDLREAAANLGLKGPLLWRKVLIPGAFPYLVTGFITASGGTWNASIVAEMVSWGGLTFKATGLGAYIAEWTGQGSPSHVLLGILVMSLYVVALNRLVWRPLYFWAAERFRLG
ncbi:MAG: sulfonate ABC transporter permease [Thermus sp.]|uniref:ABC transporter permease n=1 Tax=Thermus sp. TaxID=275 RepID=UPI00333203CC